MRKLIMTSFLLVFLSLTLFSQTAKDTTREERFQSRYFSNSQKTLYAVVQQAMKAKDPTFYFNYAHTRQLSTPVPDFRDPEELSGSILEMRLAKRFAVFKATDAKSLDFMLLSKFTVNFDFVYRIGEREEKTIDDNPGLPLNTKFGVTLFEHAFVLSANRDKDSQWGNYRKPKKEWTKDPPEFTTNKIGERFFTKETLKMLVARADLMHYSNGQDSGAFVYTPGMPVRNDYISGNFSTNYSHVMLSFIQVTKQNQLLDMTVGLRNDFQLTKWLTFDKNQKERYGICRLNTQLQYRTGPINFLWIKLRDREFIRQKRKIQAADQSAVTALKAMSTSKKNVKGLFDWSFTFSTDHILDHTDLLPDNRSSFTFETELVPLYVESVGFNFSAYYGRDYLNIRYDLPVFLWRFGFTFQIDRYRPSYESIRNNMDL